jgi:polar amino acid transport system substrate-binding protein
MLQCFANKAPNNFMAQSFAAIFACLAAGSLTTAAAAQTPNVDKALHEALPDTYKTKGVNVAAFNDWPPDEFTENGELKGWSIDMAKAMAAKLGVEFHLAGTSFETIIPGLTSSRFDAGFSSFGVTAERLKALDFIPQRMEGTAYAFLSSKPLKIANEKDLCGHSVAVLTGAWDFQFLTKVSKEVCTDKGLAAINLQQFTTQNNAELAVSSGRVEMVAAGSAKLAWLAKQTGTFSLSELTSNAVYNGIGVRKGDPLGSALKGALQALIDDGTYKTIMAKWGVDNKGTLQKALLVTEENPDPK